MSRCVEKLPHKCSEDRTSSDGLQVFKTDEGYDGYCFACGTYVPDPYHDKPEGYAPKVNLKSPQEIQGELDEISDLPSKALPSRKLRKETLETYGVKVGVSGEDGVTPHSVFFPVHKEGNLVAYKARLLDPKRMWSIGSSKEADLFGWEVAKGTGAKKLFITEGEFDTLALYQALTDKSKGTKWESYLPAVVSITNGAQGAVKQLNRFMPLLRKHFSEIVLAFDMDEPGQEAARAVSKEYPSVMVATLPSKDANSCLVEGRQKALVNSVLFKAEIPKNTRLVGASTLLTEARERAVMGYSWPWEQLTALTRGIRFGETYYVGAGVKMGKSEVVNTLGAHFIKEHKWPVLMAKPEEANKKTVKLLMGKFAGKIFHDPTVEFDEEAWDRCQHYLEPTDNGTEPLTLLNLYQHLGWNSLKEDIRIAAHEGVKAVFVDPITNLVNGISPSEANTKLQEIAQELSAMSLDLQLAIFIFCHLNNPDSGPPYERGGKILSHQFAGSRAMMRSCNYMIGIEGNKDPDLPDEQRNMRSIVVLEDREFGSVGSFKLYWDKHTGLFNEIKES